MLLMDSLLSNMMLMVFIFCFLHLPGNKGEPDTKHVHQTPPFIIKRTGQTVDSEIKCAHSITNYEQILCYKQDKGKLKFLGYLNLQYPYPEDDMKNKITFDGHGSKKSDLTISNVSLSDSGVYFCAAGSPQVNTKTFEATPHVRHTRRSCSL
ncbi:hypothetical protein INR49_013144 [Caranx melampygus]|nr:hypothetical protein INR49_013144 [Caranx melampygus]